MPSLVFLVMVAHLLCPPPSGETAESECEAGPQHKGVEGLCLTVAVPVKGGSCLGRVGRWSGVDRYLVPFFSDGRSIDDVGTALPAFLYRMCFLSHSIVWRSYWTVLADATHSTVLPKSDLIVYTAQYCIVP